MPETTFRKGDIVRLSTEAQRNRVSQNRWGALGVVVSSRGYDGLPGIRWVGLKSVYRYHPKFLELVLSDEPLPEDVAKRFQHVEMS